MFKCSHIIKISGRVTNFRRVRKAAKRDYQLRHIRPFIRIKLGFQWTQFGKSCILGPSTAVYRENSNFVEVGQQHKALYMTTKYTYNDNR